MIRLTERTKIGMIVDAQNTASRRLEKASRVAASGSNVTKPSDDPTAYSKLVRRQDTLGLMERRQQIADRASGELDVAENALSSAVDLMQSAREVAVAGSSDTADAKSRKVLAQEVEAIRKGMLNLANTRYATRFVFGGTRTDTAPFNDAGAFAGNDEVSRIPVGEGITLKSNISGAQAFTSAGGRDIFADLSALQTALENNDSNAIASSLDILDQGNNQILKIQVDAGFASQRFKASSELLTESKTSVVTEISREIQGDQIQQLTELSLARTAYEKSIEITRQILSMSGLSQQ